MDTNVILKDYDVLKETLCILNHFDRNFLDKIPSSFLEKLNELSLKSNKNVTIDASKNLKDQNISDDCKDLISFIYYKYVANQDERDQLINVWKDNENAFQKELKDKYNAEKLFQKEENPPIIKYNEDLKPESLLIIPEKNIFNRIIDFIKNIFRK